MRATPPSRRMSAGTRSSAMTAAAPAASAIFACSALTTSMMTPPFSISASPTFNRNDSFASHRLSPLSTLIVDCRLPHTTGADSAARISIPLPSPPRPAARCPARSPAARRGRPRAARWDGPPLSGRSPVPARRRRPAPPPPPRRAVPRRPSGRCSQKSEFAPCPPHQDTSRQVLAQRARRRRDAQRHFLGARRARLAVGAGAQKRRDRRLQGTRRLEVGGLLDARQPLDDRRAPPRSSRSGSPAPGPWTACRARPPDPDGGPRAARSPDSGSS